MFFTCDLQAFSLKADEGVVGDWLLELFRSARLRHLVVPWGVFVRADVGDAVGRYLILRAVRLRLNAT
ncbi:hypothetical protein EYF80_054906 [Liparis tanakae]|uniref:Uncharacterized protein n=1 Tax=Liparis tanakae TaxID=230148 RepID=A0A4Z2F144_9TELE|nr:hypothetical protein EYF80_054906 [Liparis tanakae]